MVTKHFKSWMMMTQRTDPYQAVGKAEQRSLINILWIFYRETIRDDKEGLVVVYLV